MGQVPIPDSGGDGVRWVDEDSAAARNYYAGGGSGGVRLAPNQVASGNFLSTIGGLAAGVGGFLSGGALPAIGGAIGTLGGILKGGGPTGTVPYGTGVNKGPFIPIPGFAGGSTNPRTGKKYRRMNPMNVKALRRAVRRLDSGEKLFRKVFMVKHHKSGTIVPKRRKRA